MVFQSPLQLRDCNFYLIHSTPIDSTLTFIQMSSKSLFLASLPSLPHLSSLEQFFVIKLVVSVLGHTFSSFNIIFQYYFFSLFTSIALRITVLLFSLVQLLLFTFLIVNYICSYYFAASSPPKLGTLKQRTPVEEAQGPKV